MSNPVKVTIRHNRSGEEETLVNPRGTHEEDEELTIFCWSDNNESCDCVRMEQFMRSRGQDDPDIPCSEGMFSVRIEQGGRLLLDEIAGD